MAYKRLDPEDLVMSNDSVAGAIWSNNTPTLTSYYTSSTQVASNLGQYYYSIYQTGSGESNAEVQFNIAYCDSKGSGSAYLNDLVVGTSPSRINYGQYRTLVLGDENQSFIFNNFSSSYFYVLNIERARYKEKLLTGTMTLKLSGSEGIISLTDNSKNVASTTFKDAGRVYDLVSGSAGTVYTGLEANGFTPSSGSYGWFLPDVGMLLLNGEALDGAAAAGGIGLGTGRNADTADNNPGKLYDALELGELFTMNSEETISSDYIFITPKPSEFNYSENPSFISGSTGEIIYDSFIDNPITYITTVGLYNDNNELLAVAKVSRPLPKTFTKSVSFRVKLDF